MAERITNLNKQSFPKKIVIEQDSNGIWEFKGHGFNGNTSEMLGLLRFYQSVLTDNMKAEYNAVKRSL